MHKILFSVGFLLIVVISQGQSKILDQYIEDALQNNLQLVNQTLALSKQESRIDQARKLWAPKLDLNASYLLAQGGRTIIFPIGDLFNPTYATLNQLTGNEQFPTNLENEKTQLTPNNFVDAQLNLSKPLINSTIKYNRLIQEELLRLDEIDTEITKEDIVVQIKTAYFNFHKSFEGLLILDETENILNDVLTFNQKLIKYDKATPDAIYDIEFQLNDIESQRSMINQQQETVKALFNLLLNRPLQSDITIDETLLDENLTSLESLEELQELALASRKELQKLEVAETVIELNTKRIQKEKGPELGINAGVGIQTEDFNFKDDGPLVTVGLGLSMNLFDGGLRKKKIEELMIDREIIDVNRAQLKQQISIEVLQQYYALQSLESQMRSDESALEFAQKSYDTIEKKYKNDRAILIELIQAQNRLTTSELNKTLTKYDYLIEYAKLERTLAK